MRTLRSKKKKDSESSNHLGKKRGFQDDDINGL